MRRAAILIILLAVSGFAQTIVHGQAIVKGGTITGNATSSVTNNIAIVHKCPSAGITGGNNTGTSVTCTFNGAQTSGNKILAYCTTDDYSGTISMCDGGSCPGTSVNTYTAVGFSNTNNGTSNNWNAWTTTNSSSSTLTLTCTSNASTPNLYIGAVELSGAKTTIDTAVSQTTSGLTSAAFSTTNAADGIFVFGAGGSGTTAPTAGLIAGTTGSLIGGTNNGGRAPGWEYRLLTATVSSVTGAFATGDSSLLIQVIALESQ